MYSLWNGSMHCHLIEGGIRYTVLIVMYCIFQVSMWKDFDTLFCSN